MSDNTAEGLEALKKKFIASQLTITIQQRLSKHFRIFDKACNSTTPLSNSTLVSEYKVTVSYKCSMSCHFVENEVAQMSNKHHI